MKKENQFVKIFQQAAKRYDKFNVWSDFVTIAACVISNIVNKEHYVKRDELWKRTISKYNVGNTLTDPMSAENSLDDYWFTPTYFSSVWQGRRIIQWMRQLG